MGDSEEIVHVLQDKREVFEDTEQPQIDDAADDQPSFSPCLLLACGHRLGNDPVRKGHSDEEKQIGRTGPCVEYQGKNQHNEVFPLQVGHQPVKQEIQRKKRVNKQ